MPSKSDDKPRAPYTALIYVHGMGSQRRFEETSRLIDSMDRLLTNQKDSGDDRGIIRGIKPESELDHFSADHAVTYIDSQYVRPAHDKDGPYSKVRFYEAYWAPVMAGMNSPWRVAKWILRQVLRPIATLRTPWRERQRLHRSALADLLEQKKSVPQAKDLGLYKTMLRLYREFHKLDVKSKPEYAEGTFEQFQSFVGAEAESDKDALLSLAKEWRNRYVFLELQNAVVLGTIFLAIMLLIGWLIWFVFLGMGALSGLSASLKIESLMEALQPSLTAAAGILVSLAGAIGLGGFLTNYMGDVEAWATYEETNERHEKRSKVIKVCSDLIRHVLQDEACERAVIVSHSLGTSVAHDTLLHLARHNKAANPENPMEAPIDLEKISHFFTLASPIDKISYFFESQRSKSHRYIRVVEDLRGDIGTEPFTKNKTHRNTHWINFWDEADVISGAIQSPTNRDRFDHRVDNVHVPSLAFPAPGKAHSAYFENATVIRTIYESTYWNTYGYDTLVKPDPKHKKGYDYESVALRPGAPRGEARRLHVPIVLAPWLAVIGTIGVFAKSSVVTWIGFGPMWAIIGIAFLAWLFNRSKPNKDPL